MLEMLKHFPICLPIALQRARRTAKVQKCRYNRQILPEIFDYVAHFCIIKTVFYINSEAL